MASWTENFDGVTAPSLPSTISVDAGSHVTTTTYAHSGLNSIRQNSDGEFHTVSSGVGANAILTAWILFGNKGSFTGCFFGIRRVAANGSGYWVEIKQGFSDGFQGIQFYKRSGGPAGTYTAIGSVVSVSLTATAWYQVKIIPSGNNFSVRFQRASDSNWLNSSGSWGSSEVDVITQTDSTYPSAGEAMVTMYHTFSDDQAYVDDMTYADPVIGGTYSGDPLF